MKKKLEAELISIAHRILKLKNRAELDQLRAETLKLYEKLSVLRFVEDNFSDVKPTIGYASAEEALEEIYGIEEVPPVHANEVEEKEDKERAEKKGKTPPGPQRENDEPSKDDANEQGKDRVKDSKGDIKPEGDTDPVQKVEEYQASEEEKEETEVSEKTAEENTVETETAEEAPVAEQSEEKEPKGEEKEEPAEEPEQKLEVVKPEDEVKAMEEGAAAVFEKEDESTIEEEEKAADAEVVTIEPDESAKVEDSGTSFDFAFERKAAPEEPVKQKEITFEDYHDYQEPEFVKKGEAAKEEPVKEDAAPVDDWRNWEPSKSAGAEQPAKEEKMEEPKSAAPASPKSLNDAFGKTITLSLNDRIAFEKHLFGSSSDDLNRVLSQLNTLNSYEEAKNFIEDLVKPDYNDWKGKEDFEARFMEIVEKKFG